MATAVMPRASSILVWGGVVTIGVGSKGKAMFDLSENLPLGANLASSAKLMADGIATAKPSHLSVLNLRYWLPYCSHTPAFRTHCLKNRCQS